MFSAIQRRTCAALLIFAMLLDVRPCLTTIWPTKYFAIQNN
ncbi:hypothetical protein ARMA_0419 [Ardenticatena maritima]|uniref:Uncharacterized protein n=1 Tax=Ardenticatena maritima TaxID=872965 RepID=A0A0M8K7N3_9CHLR|nr:hypothetical protein ARMA_0419 [Ardenticatena maritima]